MAEGSGGSDDARARTSVAFVGSMGRICGGDGLFRPSLDGSAGRDAGRNAGMRDDGRGDESGAVASRGRDDDEGITLGGGGGDDGALSDDDGATLGTGASAAGDDGGATLGTGAEGRIDASGWIDSGGVLSCGRRARRPIGPFDRAVHSSCRVTASM